MANMARIFMLAFLALLALGCATTKEYSDEPVDSTNGSGPVFIGSYGGECDRGPTSISVEPQVSNTARPGTSLHYQTVPALNLAARDNKYETDDCAYDLSVPPVYYTLHIWSVPQLKAYGNLAGKNFTQFQRERILATEVEAFVPTPTPGLCIYQRAVLRGKIDSDDKYVEWLPEEYRCSPGEPTGSVRWQELEDEWRGLPQHPGTGKK